MKELLSELSRMWDGSEILNPDYSSEAILGISGVVHASCGFTPEEIEAAPEPEMDDDDE